MKKIFGKLNLTWKSIIISAIILGVYTGIMAILPIAKETSFADISISFEWWILFGTLIIINSKSPKEAALKCFVFFLISQPLVYLTEAPFHKDGLSLFRYYPEWFKWTLLTLPMGYIGYYLKKDKWWGLFILTPIIIFLGFHYSGFLNNLLTYPPHHLLSAIYCVAVMIIFPLYIYKSKKLKIIGTIISIIAIITFTILAFTNGKNYYNTTLFFGDENSYNVQFDNTYKAYFKDESYGDLTIVYDEQFEAYKLNAEFKKTGKTEFTLESPDKEKYTFVIVIKEHSYDLEKK